MINASLDRFSQGAVDVQDQPLDWVADCAYLFCQKPIHFGDRCIIDENHEHYCDESCFISGNGAKTVRAGTEEYTI